MKTTWLLPLLLLACDGGDPHEDPDLAGYIAKEDWIDVAAETECRWRACRLGSDAEECLSYFRNNVQEFLDVADCYSGTRAFLCNELRGAVLDDPNGDCNTIIGVCRFSEGDFASCAAGP